MPGLKGVLHNLGTIGMSDVLHRINFRCVRRPGQQFIKSSQVPHTLWYHAGLVTRNVVLFEDIFKEVG